MPKEFIKDNSDSKHRRVGDGEIKPPLRAGIKVSWARHLDEVSLAVVTEDPDAPGHWREFEAEEDTMVTYCHLDRAGINALIRLLRKSRDQACGADA